MPDMFDAYQKALTQLRAALGSGHPDYGDVLLYDLSLEFTSQSETSVSQWNAP